MIGLLKGLKYHVKGKDISTLFTKIPLEVCDKSMFIFSDCTHFCNFYPKYTKQKL